MDNLKGVFLVLLFGSILALIYGCIEATVMMHRRSIKENVCIIIIIIIIEQRSEKQNHINIIVFFFSRTEIMERSVYR